MIPLVMFSTKDVSLINLRKGRKGKQIEKEEKRKMELLGREISHSPQVIPLLMSPGNTNFL